ncbi:MAG: ergothioneine biosynthesis protein EgtB [Chloroherpetonaceae bacterium]|nr:ergothioneine biosynthesis protein EgtB [Chloroherpetonaceae bacterium]MDW8018475.1 ergothioneine biosynthesis protein EgtB [Chloroherpetonaceae bacterium]
MHRTELAERFLSVRRETERLCAPLEIEDYVVQPIVDVSPPKWHLGHTTWFFETFVLQPYATAYQSFHPLYSFLFNSYYNAIGARTARNERGHLSRPTVKEVYTYRTIVTEKVHELIMHLSDEKWPEVSSIIELGIHHEQQHQELLVTDIKYILFTNPLRPAYQALAPATARQTAAPSSEQYVEVPAGIYCVGYNGMGFCFDNELPHHKVYLGDTRLMTRPVTNGEFLEFVESGGYRDFRHWLSDGWDTVQRERWQAPLYWEKIDGEWFEFTLSGLVPLRKEAPVSHISYYEADAFASWKGKRLPTEFEWEVAATLAQANPEQGNFLESGLLMPIPAAETDGTLQQMFGDVWEWTASAYLPYPNYQKAAGAIGEYNGKFMSGQMVLRGGSCATPQSHIRLTYRNFFQPDKRWQFSGVRLADKL